MTSRANILKFGACILAAAAMVVLTSPVRAESVLAAPTVGNAIILDGETGDWNGIVGITVPLEGNGRVSSVDLKAVVHGDTIYMLAVWEDSTEDILHKPYKWDDASKSYKRANVFEDRFAVSFRMSGNFSANKIDGSAFESDVWHWKSSRSNPAGVAHDKMWKVSTEPFKGATKFTTPDGKDVYLRRSSDSGDRLYKSAKYDVKQDDVMPRYVVKMNPKGSIADVKAKGVWRDGRWYLELARKLDTGNADDVVISSSGTIEIAVAVFNAVSSVNHSVSETISLATGNPAS